MSYDQIWMVGFSGTGKSRLARPLAAALDWKPVDIDAMIEEESVENIPAIFRRGGEGAFRTIEGEIVEHVAQMHNVVVATGGGAVLLESNREAMRRSGFIVALDARPETILVRIEQLHGHIS